MKDVIEIVAGVCGVAFDETEPAACLIARRLGVSELDVCSAFFGSDMATYERCIADGARRSLTDTTYSQALDRIQTKVLADLVGAALTEHKSLIGIFLTMLRRDLEYAMKDTRFAFSSVATESFLRHLTRI